MRRLIESLCFLAIIAAGLLLANAAAAESRLFSAKASQADVTIIQAVRNGQQLPVAGQNGAATFFRVDNPSGPVPCFNRIIFTASNGQKADSQVNICINNGALTVALAGSGGVGGIPGGGVPGGGVGGVPGGGVPGGGVPGNMPLKAQPVVIATDDPYLTINQVFLRGQPVPIAGRQDPYVQINVLGGPQGFECSRDLGLALSDGRRIARLVDICQSNFLVIVALVGGPRPPAPPPNFMPPTNQPPVVQPLPTPPEPEQPEVVDEGMQWLFSQSGDHASFAYAIPETDASEFTAVCATRSSKVTITLTRSADEVGPGTKVQVRFTAGAFSKAYVATGSEVSELDGISHPVLQLSASDPLWSALIKESVVTIAIGSSPPYALSLSGSAFKAKQFLAACNPPPALPEPPVMGGGVGGNAVGYACDDNSFLTVTYDINSAVVSEIGVPPIFLFQAPSNDGSVRYIAGLNELVGQGEQIFWTREGGFSRACTPN